MDGAGGLIARTGLGDVAFTPPIAFQQRDGVRQPVPVAYRVRGREYRFAVGAYDRTRPLVIDPLVQSTFFQGADTDQITALAIHPVSGEIYVAGWT